MTAELEEPTVATISIVTLPAEEITALGLTITGLAELRAAAIALPDEEGHDFTMKLVKTRTSLDAIATRLKLPHKEYVKQVDAEKDWLKSQLLEIEGISRPKKEAYEAAQKAAKEERERAAAAKIVERTQQVINLGMTWDGAGYVLDLHTIESIEIKAAPDDQWNIIIAEVTVYVEQVRESNRIAAEQAEADRVAEAQRLEAQREAQEAERQNLLREQQELKRQQDEFKAQLVDARTSLLTALNYVTVGKSGNVYLNNFIVVSLHELETLTNEQFTTRLNEVKTAIADAQCKAADEALYQERLSAMDNASFLFESAIYQEFHQTFTKAGIIALSDEGFQQFLSDAQTRNTDYVAQQDRLDKDKRKARVQFLARIKIERGVFIGSLTRLGKIQHPKPEQPEIIQLVDEFKAELNGLIAKYCELANNL